MHAFRWPSTSSKHTAKAPRAVPVANVKPLARCKATCVANQADAYAAKIVAAEESGDWLTAFEALTEAKVMKLQLPSDALERGIRTLAQGGQWARAADLFDSVVSSGTSPSLATVKVLFATLAAKNQPERAQALLTALEQAGATSQTLAYAQNTVVRTFARSGAALKAYAMLDIMVCTKGAVQPDMETFSCVCQELMKISEVEKAEEVLEWRDFLSDEE